MKKDKFQNAFVDDLGIKSALKIQDMMGVGK